MEVNRAQRGLFRTRRNKSSGARTRTGGQNLFALRKVDWAVPWFARRIVLVCRIDRLRRTPRVRTPASFERATGRRITLVHGSIEEARTMALERSTVLLSTGLPMRMQYWA